jgi:hypothetical protein
MSLVNEVEISGDYRFGLPQGEIDNISLTQTATQTPEPSTLLLTALSGLGLLAMKIRMRHSERKRRAAGIR